MQYEKMLSLLASAILALNSTIGYAQNVKRIRHLLSSSSERVYMKADGKRSVTVFGGGSGEGISALIEGSTDIAMSSRKINSDKKTQRGWKNFFRGGHCL